MPVIGQVELDAFLSEQPSILSEDGNKKTSLTGPIRAPRTFNKPLMTFRKNFPLFFQLSFVGHLDEFPMKSHGP